jgi:parvulin-like peptidyl-prolyl isomerase
MRANRSTVLPRLALLVAFAAPALTLCAAPVVTVVAKVADQVITNVDLDDAVKVVAAAMSEQERNSPEGQKKLAEARRNVLSHMIEMRLVVQAAKDGPEGFKEAVAQGKASTNPFLPDSSEIETEMEKLFDQTRQSFPDQEAFETALLKEHNSVPEFRNKLREQVKDQMTYQRMIKMKERELQPSLRVSDEEAEAYYKDHADAFAMGDQVKLRHILYPAADEAKATAALAQLRKAKDVKAAFIALARKDSADTPTRDQGGLLGWIEKGQSWPELEKLAFATADGQLAGPVKTDAGWHLLLVEGHQSGKARSFDEVKANARNLVYQEKLKARQDEWIDELKTKYYVEKHDEDAKP